MWGKDRIGYLWAPWEASSRGFRKSIGANWEGDGQPGGVPRPGLEIVEPIPQTLQVEY